MAATITLLEQIGDRLEALSRAERRVAEWIVANPRRSIELSIGALASAAGVSEPTVVRCARSLGLSGYRELKTRLLVSVHGSENYVHHDVSAADSGADAVAKVLDSAIRGLVDLRDHAPALPFAVTAAALARARVLTFVGIGASGHVAADAQHKFFRLGMACNTAVDAQTILQSAAIARAGDAFIAISNTGTWPELVAGMRIARERGATVIAVTDPDAPLAAVADQVFACPSLEDTSVFTPMSSRLIHLALLDALQVALALALGSSAESNLRLSKDVLRQMRGQGAIGGPEASAPAVETMAPQQGEASN